MRSITRELAVLFEDGPWRISRTGYGDGSGIWHLCGEEWSAKRKCEDKFNLADEWWRDYRSVNCQCCGAAIPAEIRGLYLLHTWDR